MPLKRSKPLFFLSFLMLSFLLSPVLSSYNLQSSYTQESDDAGDLSSQPSSEQDNSLASSVGLNLDKFVPGSKFDINGAQFTISEDEIIVQHDNGLQDLKFGLEVAGGAAVVFAGWSPVGIIDVLPRSQVFTLIDEDNTVVVTITNNMGLSTNIEVVYNEEKMLYKENEALLTLFLEIDQPENQMKITYAGNEGKLDMVEDLANGEKTFGDVEVDFPGYEVDQIPSYKAAAGEVDKKGEAVIKKLSAQELEDLANGKKLDMATESSSIVEIIIAELQVLVVQDGNTIGSFELKKQEVLQFVEQDGDSIQIVLTPEGGYKVRADVLQNGVEAQSKEGDSQLVIRIVTTAQGSEIAITSDEDCLLKRVLPSSLIENLVDVRVV